MLRDFIARFSRYGLVVYFYGAYHCAEVLLLMSVCYKLGDLQVMNFDRIVNRYIVFFCL